MEAIKIPREHRYLLLAGPAPVTRWRLLKVLYLTRWAGQARRGEDSALGQLPGPAR